MAESRGNTEVSQDSSRDNDGRQYSRQQTVQTSKTLVLNSTTQQRTIRERCTVGLRSDYRVLRDDPNNSESVRVTITANTTQRNFITERKDARELFATERGQSQAVATTWP